MADISLRLAENISLLNKINRTPVPPQKNKLQPDADGDRVLQLRQELDLAECLTYLSAYSNEAEKVMACCVEERTDQQGLTISIAVNTGSASHL
jgi:hypothetical protein